MKRKTPKMAFRTLLIAAAVTVLLAVTAYAAWSIHNERQQEIREQLNIEQSNALNYVEYSAPAEKENKPVLLSALNDGTSQHIYVDVAPVAGEELSGFPGRISFGWNIEGTDLWGMAFPWLDPGSSLSGQEQIREAVMEQAWDEETETMTLECIIDGNFLEQARLQTGSDRFSLRLALFDEHREIRSFGSVSFAPTPEDTVVFDFGRQVWKDTENGKELTLVGLDLSPTAAVWRFDFPDAEQIYDAAPSDPEAGDLLNEWLNSIDRVCMEAELLLEDGTCFQTGGCVAYPFEDGTATAQCGWGTAVDIRTVEKILLDGTVIWQKTD